MTGHSIHQPSTITNLQWLGAVLAVLVAALLRSLPLLDNRFHPDEALYASFAQLIASGRDPLLSGVIVDKPPLSMYVNGLSLVVFGGNELAARLPNFFASLISVALLFALTRRLYDRPTAQIAAWAFALSPFAILFSITVFIDPLITAFGLWGLWEAASRRSRRAGLAFALAFAAKQTALIFLPLAIGLALLALPSATSPRQALGQLVTNARPIVVALLISALVVFGWDFVRRAPIGFWGQGYSDNMPGRFIRANEVLPRARAVRNTGSASPPSATCATQALPHVVSSTMKRSASMTDSPGTRNSSIWATSRPTVRSWPSLAMPANSAVATSGTTTIDSRLRNSVPRGRTRGANGARSGTRPRTMPAIKPKPIHTWLLI